ncbi:competence/damage-inducible protein CinA-like protein [Bernardetia litoralis DSM 6794]|uniref:CinA-like protein n=1 Tax=Bernardetia litoralis (strain ATCC 23117 / DSM 6794 / NBRC 15988 / NCIMB 1366 / Fx l1 / Sio-4) TaxID=880071 RepID=I4AJ83_BERLS|nr:competence/damage-inducible protein A [Bernardetia litoralis]AFM04018.1 competence/damage-inducible protein CinA-like protein [Bernardetia litoralis DSM 6794]
MIPAYIVAIGDELLYGQTLNTNAHSLSKMLTDVGFKVVKHISIADERQVILDTVEEMSKVAKIVLITGGLGPTKDDITKKTFAEYFNVGMRRDEEVLKHIENLFSSRGREMTELNQTQADVPTNCKTIPNALGTAPAMWFEKEGCIFISMPGVPFETENIMEKEVIPRLLEFFKPPFIVHKKIQTISIPESILAQKIEDWENNLPSDIHLAYLPHLGKVTLRLTCEGDDKEKIETELNAQVQKVLPLIEKYVYGFDDETIEGKVADLLKEKNLTLGIAESCTGGYTARTFTQHEGASKFFEGGIIAYSNDVKIKVLGVKLDTIVKYGAVSEQTALEMAEGVRKLLGTKIGIATTGVAGTGGGTPEKPVGTVWIAYSDENETVAKTYQLTKNRNLNIQLTTNAVLNLLRKKMIEM